MTRQGPDREFLREEIGEVTEQRPPATGGAGEGERSTEREESTSSKQEGGLAGEGSDGMCSVSETTVADGGGSGGGGGKRGTIGGGRRRRGMGGTNQKEEEVTESPKESRPFMRH
ncbi:unnamed protein product [Lampetra planeri]